MSPGGSSRGCAYRFWDKLNQIQDHWNKKTVWQKLGGLGKCMYVSAPFARWQHPAMWGCRALHCSQMLATLSGSDWQPWPWCDAKHFNYASNSHFSQPAVGSLKYFWPKYNEEGGILLSRNMSLGYGCFNTCDALSQSCNRRCLTCCRKTTLHCNNSTFGLSCVQCFYAASTSCAPRTLLFLSRNFCISAAYAVVRCLSPWRTKG